MRNSFRANSDASKFSKDRLHKISDFTLQPARIAFGHKYSVVKIDEKNQFNKEKTPRSTRVTAKVLFVLLFPVTIPVTLLGALANRFSKTYKKLNSEKKEFFKPVESPRSSPTKTTSLDLGNQPIDLGPEDREDEKKEFFEPVEHPRPSPTKTLNPGSEDQSIDHDSEDYEDDPELDPALQIAIENSQNQRRSISSDLQIEKDSEDKELQKVLAQSSNEAPLTDANLNSEDFVRDPILPKTERLFDIPPLTDHEAIQLQQAGSDLLDAVDQLKFQGFNVNLEEQAFIMQSFNNQSGIPPSKPETSPEKSETSPEKPETIPEKSETTPEKSETSPEKPETIPEKSETTPEKSETIPEKSETTPEESETTPEKSETTPEKSETSPAMPKTSPAMPETPPSAPESSTEKPEDEEPTSQLPLASAAAAEPEVPAVAPEASSTTQPTLSWVLPKGSVPTNEQLKNAPDNIILVEDEHINRFIKLPGNSERTCITTYKAVVYLWVSDNAIKKTKDIYPFGDKPFAEENRKTLMNLAKTYLADAKNLMSLPT